MSFLDFFKWVSKSFDPSSISHLTDQAGVNGPGKKNDVERSNAAFTTLKALSIVALIFLLIFSLFQKKGGSNLSWASIFALLVFIAFVGFLVGSLIGFLFGIPRTLQGTSTATTATSSPNTNLEQISDWLTKILVGVGLIQIKEIEKRFSRLANRFSEALFPTISNKFFSDALCSSIIIAFAIDGFLMAYLWTRLFLAKIQDQTVDEKIAAADENDREATSLTFKQLNLSANEKDLSKDDLCNVYLKASKTGINNVFISAVNSRLMWKDKAEGGIKIARTISIFEALIKADVRLEYPENFAQLGLAFKDKENADYNKALENLDKAFEGYRKKQEEAALGSLYYPRAYCRIKTKGESALIKKDIEDGDKFKDVTEMKKEQMDEIEDWRSKNMMG